MARYLVLEKSYLNNALVEAGAEVEYDGQPGPNLQLIAKKGKAAEAARRAAADLMIKATEARDAANAARAESDTHPGDTALAIAAQEAEQAADAAEAEAAASGGDLV